MSKEKRRVPKLRFPGFTEDWEQRKLCQITTRVTRKNGDQSDLPLTISAQDGLVDQRKYFNRQVASRDMSNYYLIKKGEFAYNKSYSEGYPFGAVKRLDYYDIGALSTLYILFEITDNNISSDFIVSYYMTHLWYKEISKRAAEGARNHGLLNISTEDFFDSELNIPNSIEEQVKIGNFIKQFDKFITLHQRKLDNLKLKKKALLQKLFPKNGERYPELRFPGFTDAWEQRKADYIFKSVTDKGYPELPVLSASQELGMVYRDQNGIDIQHDQKNETSYKRVLPGQFVIHLRSFQGGFAYSEIEGITSPAYTVMSFKHSSEQYGLFWKHVFKSKTFIKRLETITYGIRDGRSISFSDFKSLLLQYPSFSEQKLIGDSIAVIERGITLHQRKLDHLKLQKKALLQQMFV